MSSLKITREDLDKMYERLIEDEEWNRIWEPFYWEEVTIVQKELEKLPLKKRWPVTPQRLLEAVQRAQKRAEEIWIKKKQQSASDEH